MTVFERIAAGELPAFVIHDEEEYMGILDIFPTHPGQGIVFPKKAVTSKLTEVPLDVLNNTLIVAQKVAKKMEQNLPKIDRVIIVIEGLEVDHFHIKLYPAYHPEPTDYAVTSAGEKADEAELAKFQKLIVGE